MFWLDIVLAALIVVAYFVGRRHGGTSMLDNRALHQLVDVHRSGQDRLLKAVPGTPEWEHLRMPEQMTKAAAQEIADRLADGTLRNVQVVYGKQYGKQALAEDYPHGATGPAPLKTYSMTDKPALTQWVTVIANNARQDLNRLVGCEGVVLGLTETSAQVQIYETPPHGMSGTWSIPYRSLRGAAMTELSRCYYCRIGDCKKCIDTKSRTMRVCGCDHDG